MIQRKNYLHSKQYRLESHTRQLSLRLYDILLFVYVDQHILPCLEFYTISPTVFHSKAKVLTNCHVNSPDGRAIPYPLASSSPPTCVSLQYLSVTYSMLEDSMRKAYCPSPCRARSTPSWLLPVYTDGRCDSINANIFWYVGTLEVLSREN